MNIPDIRRRIANGATPQECASDSLETIFFGDSGDSDDPSKGIIFALGSLLRYKTKLNTYYRSRDIPQEDIPDMHAHVLALMYLRRSAMKPGDKVDSMRTALEPIYAMDQASMAGCIDDFILKDADLVTDATVGLRGLSGFDIQELRDLQTKAKERHTPLGKLAIMDDAQLAAVRLLEHTLTNKDELPEEIRAMMGTHLFSFQPQKGKTTNGIYIISEGKKGARYIQWFVPKISEGKVVGLIQRQPGPSTHVFMNRLLKGDITLIRPLDDAEATLVATYESDVSRVVDMRNQSGTNVDAE
jgi:hypothetical protein